MEEKRQGLGLEPGSGVPYANLANSLFALQRFDEVRQTVQQAEARKLDRPTLRMALYALAFLRGDSLGLKRNSSNGFGGQTGRTLRKVFTRLLTPKHTRVISQRRAS